MYKIHEKRDSVLGSSDMQCGNADTGLYLSGEVAVFSTRAKGVRAV